MTISAITGAVFALAAVLAVLMRGTGDLPVPRPVTVRVRNRRR